MRIIPNLKILGLAGLMAVTTSAVFSCQNRKTNNKPMYDVTLAQPCDRWFAEGSQKSFPVKMEEGCSYESSDKKYVMCNGHLYSIDKKNNVIQREDTIKVSDYEAEVFKQIAGYNHSAKDTMELSAENIKKFLPEHDYEQLSKSGCLSWRPSVLSKKVENGFEAKILTIPYHTNVFKYNDTVNE